MREKKLIQYATLGLWNLPFLLLYGIAVLRPSVVWASTFVILGVIAASRQVFRAVTNVHGNEKTPMAGHLVRTASDLIGLILIQQGLIQTMIELSRGNRVGAVIYMVVTTPLLFFLARALVMALGRTVWGGR